MRSSRDIYEKLRQEGDPHAWGYGSFLVPESLAVSLSLHQVLIDDEGITIITSIDKPHLWPKLSWSTLNSIQEYIEDTRE